MFLHGPLKSGRYRYIISATLSYAVFALLWIFLSDQLLAVFSDIREIVWLSTAKGVGFVMVSTLLLFFALRFVPSGEQHHFSLDSIVVEREQPLRWPRWMAYAFAATITLVALWIRQTLQVSVELRSLMTIFMFPIILSAALGGVGPGLLATGIAAFFVNFFVIQPAHSLLR